MILCGLALVLPTCFAQQNPPSEGRVVMKLYADQCAGCHGADMAGGSASSLVDGQWRYGGDDASIAVLARAIPMRVCQRCVAR